MTDDIKKGIGFTAAGFLFILVNLTFNHGAVDFMPDFIGWILILPAVGRLHVYTENRAYLKWIAMGLILISGAIWAGSVLAPKIDLSLLKSVSQLASVIFCFIYFDALREVSEDAGSRYTDQIVFLRWTNIAVFLNGAVMNIIVPRIEINTAIASMVMIYGFIGIAAAVWTCIVLFRLRNEIRQL